jgi:2-keto-4-pentenoate hydratase/2-oxohepta-3-ene-1,7-dioic acid hydratase in catechol pathway
MKLGTFKTKNHTFIGVVIGDEVVELVKAAAHIPEFENYQQNFSDMQTLLPELNRVRDLLNLNRIPIEAKNRLTDVEVLAPVTNPNKIICIGLNYLDHAKESGEKIPSEPVIFSKFKTSIVGPNSPIILPRQSKF